MNWIEGVGDEVTLFFALLAIVIVGTIAWLSTNIGEQPVIRTVLLVERWSRQTHEIVDPGGVARSSNVVGAGDSGGDASHDNIYAAVGQGCQCENDVSITDIYTTSASASTLDSATTPESAANAPRNRRLSTDNSSLSDAETVDPGVAGLNAGSGADPESVPPGHIWIRLKYLNDDQKLVQGRLEEPLGDFKRRHFTSELTADNLVRLIFNGHILQRDADTLESYGLFDNCVVHCLVHQQRPSPENAFVAPQAAETQAAADNNIDWNVGNALPVLLTLLIGMAWYGRYQYSHLFSATTSVTLVGLTVILVLSLLGVYLPGQEVAAPFP